MSMLWTQAGPENTDETIRLALEKAEQLSINNLVIASCSGDTIKKTLAYNKNLNIICVTHHVGFQNPGEDEMDMNTRQYLGEQGVKILTTTHLFAGVDRAIRKQFSGLYPAEIIAQTLRIFGQGVKVAIEIAVMALDAGLIPYGCEVISIGGTVEGADAAIVIKPAHSDRFFSTQVKEIICMPSRK